jgi:hypothetical protein
VGRGWAGTVSRNTEPRARLFGPPRLREIRPRYAPLPVRGFGPSLSPVSREADRQRHHQDRPVGGSLRRSGNRLAVACGFTPRSLRGVAAGAEPEVRVHLPPAKSRANFRFLSGGVLREGGLTESRACYGCAYTPTDLNVIDPLEHHCLRNAGFGPTIVGPGSQELFFFLTQAGSHAGIVHPWRGCAGERGSVDIAVQQLETETLRSGLFQ